MIQWHWVDDETAEIRFLEAQRALAVGQVLAFYRHDCLVGGGTYQEVLGKLR